MKETVMGLRALADFLEANPDFPRRNISMDIWPDTKERMVELGRMLGSYEKIIGGSFYILRKRFSEDVKIDVTSMKELVCKVKSVKIEKVEAQFYPAYDREVVEYECGESLLKGD